MGTQEANAKAKNRGMPKAMHTIPMPKKLKDYRDSVKPGLHTSLKDGSKARTGGK